MIGADEFNIRKSQSTSQSTGGDIDDTQYIETFLALRGATDTEPGFLIDIVCPQPRSQRPRGMSGKKGQASRSTTNRGRK